MKIFLSVKPISGFPGGSVYKESACNAGDLGLIFGLGRSPGEGNDNPLKYSFLGNPMDRGAWQATVHGVLRVRHDLVTKLPPPPRQSMWSKQGNMTTLEPQTLKSKSLIFKRTWIWFNYNAHGLYRILIFCVKPRKLVSLCGADPPHTTVDTAVQRRNTICSFHWHKNPHKINASHLL